MAAKRVLIDVRIDKVDRCLVQRVSSAAPALCVYDDSLLCDQRIEIRCERECRVSVKRRLRRT